MCNKLKGDEVGASCIYMCSIPSYYPGLYNSNITGWIQNAQSGWYDRLVIFFSAKLTNAKQASHLT